MTDCRFPKVLESPGMCTLSLPVTELTDGVLKCLVRLIVNCSSLEVLDCCLSTST